MTKEHHKNRKINTLFRRGEWEEARRILEREQEKAPDNHWVVTQLGVSYYEQRRYKAALRLFLASQKIVRDCPLTLWNLAGTLDALGKHAAAMRIYTWILQSKTSSADDPCWESRKWADALKTDCVYRVGVCFQHLGKTRRAEDRYREYLRLLSLGIEGSYSFNDVKRQMRQLQEAGRTIPLDSELRKAVNATLQASGIDPRRGRRKTPPELSLRGLLPARLSASKK